MVTSARAQPGFRVGRHLEALGTSSELTCYFRRMYQPMAAQIRPEAVIEILHEANVRCVLMGTYGISGWRSEPRATQDVDVLVPRRALRKAVQALMDAFPQLTVSSTPAVIRFLDPVTKQVVIDVMVPAEPLYRVAFRYAIPVGTSHRIPDLEMALASKFAAMLSPMRETDKKMIDAGDFINMVRHNREAIKLPKLERLAERVRPGGGAQILEMIREIDAGRTLRV